MIGVAANVITVILGCLTGCIFRKGISKKISDSAMIAVGLSIICIGVSGMLESREPLVLVISMVLGTILGTSLDVDGKINVLGDKIAGKFSKSDKGQSNIAEGFITASLVFCVGSMTILGGLNAGLKGDNTLYYTKAVLDFISATMLTTSIGIGVILSSVTVLLYQGALVLLASLLEPVFTQAIISEINGVGSVMIFALGLNLAGVAKFKVANFLPAIIITPFACMAVEAVWKLIS